jgi:PERQ amino acid-rich with GYF domain-containing protein
LPPSSVRTQVVAQSYGVQCWYYIDPNGAMQGPFDDMQMQQWNENGYFTPDLRMKRGEHNEFVQLGMLFENLQVAFQPGQGPVPPHF